MNTQNNTSGHDVEFIEEWDWTAAVPTGKAVSRSIAHKQGIPHEGVHLWIVRAQPDIELLFQRRAKDKELYPDCLDITVGGHVPFGINEQKIQKESYEEIGISPSDEELIDLGYYRYEEKTGSMHHREFQHVFMLLDNSRLDRYKFMDGEVIGIYAVKLDDLAALLKRDIKFSVEVYEPDNTANSLPCYYAKIFKKDVSRKDFHPLLFTRPMKEYMKIIIQASMEIASGKPISIRMPLKN